MAGLAAMPDQYFRVPAMRMILDLAVYLGMLAVFSTVVLFHEDGPLTSGEIAFTFYLLVRWRNIVYCSKLTVLLHLCCLNSSVP